MLTNRVLRKVTPLLAADSIEPVLKFWLKLGVSPIIQVPDSESNDGSLAFAILEAPGIEIMYQTMAALRTAQLSHDLRFPLAILYIFVEDVSTLELQLQGESVVVPRRTTDFGHIEIAYADPGGNVLFFVQYQPLDGKSH